MITPPPALPTGHLLLTPDAIPYEFLEYLESAEINDPGDDLDFIVITDADRLVQMSADDDTLSWSIDDGSPLPWLLPWEDQLSQSINRSSGFVDWYKIEFADGLKAVGVFSH
jgi:hypothetical protein